MRVSQEIALEAAEADVDYDFGDRAGTLVLAFSIDTPGTYVLKAGYPAGAPGPETVLAIGSSPDPEELAKKMAKGAGVMCAAFAGSAICGLVGVILGIVALMRRSKAKKQVAETFPPAQ